MHTADTRGEKRSQSRKGGEPRTPSIQILLRAAAAGVRYVCENFRGLISLKADRMVDWSV